MSKILVGLVNKRESDKQQFFDRTAPDLLRTRYGRYNLEVSQLSTMGQKDQLFIFCILFIRSTLPLCQSDTLMNYQTR